MANQFVPDFAALAEGVRLSPGSHRSPADGMCAMELAAFLEGEPHSDRPLCVSVSIGDFVRHLNDNVPDEMRPRLLPFVPRMVATASKFERQRVEYFAWRTITVLAPAALRAKGHRRFATILERAATFRQAERIARTIRKGIARRETGEIWEGCFNPTHSPVDLAVHRACHAAMAAPNATKDALEIVFWDDFCSCGYLAASAAFQAAQAGCQQAWDLAFATLDGALRIGHDPESSKERELPEIAAEIPSL